MKEHEQTPGERNSGAAGCCPPRVPSRQTGSTEPNHSGDQFITRAAPQPPAPQKGQGAGNSLFIQPRGLRDRAPFCRTGSSPGRAEQGAPGSSGLGTPRPAGAASRVAAPASSRTRAAPGATPLPPPATYRGARGPAQTLRPRRRLPHTDRRGRLAAPPPPRRQPIGAPLARVTAPPLPPPPSRAQPPPAASRRPRPPPGLAGRPGAARVSQKWAGLPAKRPRPQLPRAAAALRVRGAWGGAGYTGGGDARCACAMGMGRGGGEEGARAPSDR